MSDARWRWAANAAPTLRGLAYKLRQRATLHAQLAPHATASSASSVSASSRALAAAHTAFLGDASAQAALKKLKALDAAVVGGKLEHASMDPVAVARAYAKDPLGVGRDRVVPLGLRLHRPDAYARLWVAGGWVAERTTGPPPAQQSATRRLATRRPADRVRAAPDESTADVSVRMWCKGYTVARVAALRTLSEGSVHRHLRAAYPTNTRLQMPAFVDGRRAQAAYRAVVGWGTDVPTKALMARAPSCTYADVEWVRAYVLARFWDFGVPRARGDADEAEAAEGVAEIGIRRRITVS